MLGHLEMREGEDDKIVWGERLDAWGWLGRAERAERAADTGNAAEAVQL